MNVKIPAFVLLLVATVVVGFAQPAENAQFKAQQEALKREKEAEAAVVKADIARNPNGKNAILARENAAAEEVKAKEAQTAEEKTKSENAAKASEAAKAEEEKKKKQDAEWAAGAAERARIEAAKKAAIEKWRASSKPAPSIIVTRKSDGTINVMVDGKITNFKTSAEADAFIENTRKDTTLSY